MNHPIILITLILLLFAFSPACAITYTQTGFGPQEPIGTIMIDTVHQVSINPSDPAIIYYHDYGTDIDRNWVVHNYVDVAWENGEVPPYIIARLKEYYIERGTEQPHPDIAKLWREDNE